MKIFTQKKTSIDEVVETLKKGGLVIMPTETLYGAFVDATNPKAVKKLTQYKNRPFGKPYSVAVTTQKMAEKYVELNETAKNLYKTFLPGPMTIVSKGRHNVANGVESETGSLGIRIPDYKLVTDIVKKLGKPLTATSANASYKARPYKVLDILGNISEKQKKLIDLIIDSGELPHNEPSTVIDTILDASVVLRQGKIKLKGKNEVLSKSEENTQNIGKELWQKYEKYYGKRAIVFALEGPMGAGKTQFTKGLARAMGINDEVVSPTYNLEEEYDKGKLLHIDAWRMLSDSEFVELDFAKKITDKSIISIEWADKVSDEIRKYSEEAIVVWIKIIYLSRRSKTKKGGDNERLISWETI